MISLSEKKVMISFPFYLNREADTRKDIFTSSFFFSAAFKKYIKFCALFCTYLIFQKDYRREIDKESIIILLIFLIT
jgi:hypothetical protein